MLGLFIFAAFAFAIARRNGSLSAAAPVFNTDPAILAIDAAYSAAANGLED